MKDYVKAKTDSIFNGSPHINRYNGDRFCIPVDQSFIAVESEVINMKSVSIKDFTMYIKIDEATLQEMRKLSRYPLEDFLSDHFTNRFIRALKENKVDA